MRLGRPWPRLPTGWDAVTATWIPDTVITIQEPIPITTRSASRSAGAGVGARDTLTGVHVTTIRGGIAAGDGVRVIPAIIPLPITAVAATVPYRAATPGIMMPGPVPAPGTAIR
jgi:hypothetical protein